MRTTARNRLFWPLAALASSAFLLASPAPAQSRDEYGDVQQTVARIASIEGSASFARGDDPDNWQAADQNVPMTIGDRIYTGSRSRLELELHGGEVVRLGAQTDLAALNLTDDTKQFSVKGGVASFQITRLEDNEVFEIDTPNAAITVDQPGNYRVDVDEDGNTRVAVPRGHLTVAAGGGQVSLQTGDEMNVDGIDDPRYDVVALREPDGWDRWVEQRGSRLAQTASLQYVSRDVVGAEDLDEYGRWQEIPSYGRVWSPNAVAADWVPYRVGHWVWQDPWGWTWVSAEPWGWAPYHYGRWVVYSSRWYWVPVAPAVRVAVYSPALVAFVGGGPGWSGSVGVGGGGFVGWFPLGPRDTLLPWWKRRASVNVQVTNVTYVNRTYVTVVNQNTFVSGGLVTNAVVRDRNVLRQVASAPVARGSLPVVPTAAALRVAVRPNLPAPPRPSARVLARPVMARIAPPPSPPSFQAKLAVIQENHGAPIAAAQAARMSVESRGRAQSINQIRPVAAETGKVTLAPRGGAAGTAAHRAEPITAGSLRGRPAATAQQPVAAGPVTSGNTRAGAPVVRQLAPTPQQNIRSTEKNDTRSVERGRVTNEQNAPSRGLERPTAVPRQILQPTARPSDRGLVERPGRVTSEQNAPPRGLERPTAVPRQISQPTARPSDRGRVERPLLEERSGRVTPRATPQVESRTGSAPAREGRPIEEHAPPPPQRQAVRPASQPTAQPKKEERGREKPKKPEEKKGEKEKKPE